jgi:predicted N-acetyltransferase YhbS
MISIRPVRDEDTESCARIQYEAFKDIADRHNFPLGFDPDRMPQVVRARIAQPSVFGVVAETEGRVIGFCFVLESDPIRGLGPICVDPSAQASGLGRQLMVAAIEHARGATGIRLVQVAYNSVSLSLYASLGFEVKEPLALMRGKPRNRPPGNREVRPLTSGDIEECDALGRTVHGFGRGGELRQAVATAQEPLIAVRDSRIVGYVSARLLSQAAHGVAETEDDLQALLVDVGTASTEPYTLLVPIRQATLFRWCLAEGMRVVRPHTLMSMGAYQDPRGCWFPSILY